MIDVGSPAKARILVVDDSSLVRLYYRRPSRRPVSRSSRRLMASRLWKGRCRSPSIW